MSNFFFRLGTGITKTITIGLYVVKKGLRLVVPVLLGYLVQVSVVPYLTLLTGRGIMPNLMIAVLSVIVVAKGRLQAFWVGAFYGMVTELMLSTLLMVNLIFYPAATIFVGMFTGDKSEDRMTRERNKKGEVTIIHPYLRTLIAAASYCIFWETTMMVYWSLRGSILTVEMFWRALLNTLLTCGSTMLIMLPLRKWLGVHHQRKQQQPEYTMH